MIPNVHFGPAKLGDMDLDAEAVGAWLGRWWVEATLGLVALVGAATGLWRGDVVRTAVAVALAVAVADRVRLRLDNRSLAAAVREVRDERVSAVRRGTETAASAEEGREAGAGTSGGESGDGEDGPPDAGAEATTRSPAEEN